MLDSLLVAYLSLHAALALLCDVQALLPDLSPPLLSLYQRAGLTSPIQNWIDTQGDFLFDTKPLWFKATVSAELLFQAPMCAYLAYAWIRRRQSVRLPSIVYSVHVLTTMVPIMAELTFDPRPTAVCKLVYGVWVLLPALLLIRCLRPPPLFTASSRTLWKLASTSDVEAWMSLGHMVGSSLDVADGFVHASDSRMIRTVAATFFRGKEVPKTTLHSCPPVLHSCHAVQAILLEIPAAKLPKSTRWIHAADESDAQLAVQVAEGLAHFPCKGRPHRVCAQVRETNESDFVRVLDDGCLHVHLRAPLQMTDVITYNLAWRDGVHVFPSKCS